MKSAIIKYNIFSDDLILSIRDYCLPQRKHRLNLTSWTDGQNSTSGPILLYDLNSTLINRIVEEMSPHLPKLPSCIWHATYTIGSRFSYIPWHDDGKYIYGITTYLNDTWDYNWGGALLYAENNDLNDLRAVYPSYNKTVIIPPPLQHCTTMPNIHAPLRVSLQIFIEEKNDNAIL